METKDLAELIKADHEAVNDLFNSLRLMPGGLGETRAREFAGLRAALERHASMEESLVYPLFGDELFADLSGEHQEAQDLLDEMETAGPQDPTFQARLSHLHTAVRTHVDREERDILPQLTSVATADELQSVAAQWEARLTGATEQSRGTRPVAEERPL